MQNTIMIAASYTLTLSQILHVHGKAMQLQRQSVDLYINLNWEAVEKLYNGETSSAYVKQIMYSTDAATTWKYVLKV